jgi:hypothetical protein
MEEYIKWLENKIEVCLEDKDLQREHWAFCQALKKYRELALRQPLVSGQSEQLVCDNHSPDLEHFMKYSESICKNCKQKV